ncbi:MAG: hypothetical protein ACRYGR_02785 [Janthinobacterium lividum]
MAANALPDVPTGARCVFKINGQTLMYARSVAISEQIDYQPVNVLNDVRVAQFVPTAYRVTLTASTIRLVGTTLKSLGFFAKTGQDSTTQLLSILNIGELVAELQDSVSGKTLATVNGVKIASHNFSVDSQGMISEDVEFVAVSVSDESETA